jgi:hypothetical protein
VLVDAHQMQPSRAVHPQHAAPPDHAHGSFAEPLASGATHVSVLGSQT